MPPIAAGALVASDNERPAAPSTGTALLRFRRAVSFVCDVTRLNALALHRRLGVMLGAYPRQVSKKTEKLSRRCIGSRGTMKRGFVIVRNGSWPTAQGVMP